MNKEEKIMSIYKSYVIFFLLCLFPTVGITGGSGIRMNFENFTIYAHYNDHADDKITGVDYIRNPDGLLFDLIKLIQDNQSIIKKSNKKISIDIGNHNKYLFITQNNPVRKEIVDIRNINHLDKKLIMNTLCKSLTNKECNYNQNSNIYIYLSTLLLSSSSSDLIQFGCFPCKNDRSISLSDRFVRDQPNEQTPKFKKTLINRQTIYHYFNKLR